MKPQEQGELLSRLDERTAAIVREIGDFKTAFSSEMESIKTGIDNRIAKVENNHEELANRVELDIKEIREKDIKKLRDEDLVGIRQDINQWKGRWSILATLAMLIVTLVSQIAIHYLFK